MQIRPDSDLTIGIVESTMSAIENDGSEISYEGRLMRILPIGIGF